MDAQIEDVEVLEPTEDMEGRVIFYLTDGRSIGIPLSWSWRLQEATPEQRENYEIYADGYGVHWPDLDEDLSAKGATQGTPAPRPVEIDGEEARREAWPPGRIKRLRQRLGDTQKEFADRIGVRQGTVSNWETGTHIPRKMAVPFLDQIASANPLHKEIEKTKRKIGKPQGTPKSEGSPPSESSVEELRRESDFDVHSDIEQ